ncbi:transposase InsO family protein [Bradyrhizobium japonicum]|uniref:Transposase InsO family protein n=1 Tax=Bradyrhizobium japonicum TaxID=375 RepID=A0ABV2S6I4_BRAJP
MADTSLSGTRVAQELDRLIAERDKPKMVVNDNGTELTSNAILTWADQSRVVWLYFAPGKPMQNAFIESFNGWLRDEFVERDAVHVAGPDPRHPGMLACQPQRCTTTLTARMEDPVRVRLHKAPRQIQLSGRTQDWIKLDVVERPAPTASKC